MTSEAELDARLAEINRRMAHESNTVAEEKKMIALMKKLEVCMRSWSELPALVEGAGWHVVLLICTQLARMSLFSTALL